MPKMQESDSWLTFSPTIPPEVISDQTISSTVTPAITEFSHRLTSRSQLSHGDSRSLSQLWSRGHARSFRAMRTFRGKKSSGSRGDTELRGHSGSQSPSGAQKAMHRHEKFMSRTHSWLWGNFGVRITKSFMATRYFMARKVIGYHEVIHDQEVHSWSRGKLRSRGRSGLRGHCSRDHSWSWGSLGSGSRSHSWPWDPSWLGRSSAITRSFMTRRFMPGHEKIWGHEVIQDHEPFLITK